MPSPVHGSDRAREALERSQYAGPTPVPIQVYNESVLRQAQGRPTVTNRVYAPGLSHLVLEESTFQRIGPAVNSGTSIFYVRSSREWKNKRCPSYWQYDPA